MVFFVQPWFLLGLLLLPPLAWWHHRRPRPALLFPDVKNLQTLPRGRAPKAERWGLGLRLLGLSLLVVALAEPRLPIASSPDKLEGIALVFVVDVSRSMAERDFPWQGQTLSRLEGVQKVFRLLVEGGTGPAGEKFAGRPQDLMGLVVFAARPETICPLTLDHAILQKLLDAQKPRDDLLEGTTNPGDAIGWTLNELSKAPTRRKAIIFLTDGESNVPEALTPRQAAHLAGNLKIPIYALDASNEPDAKAAASARESLEAVANLSQGKYFRAGDGSQLLQALAGIDQLERTAIEGLGHKPYVALFPWLGLGCLLTWFLVIVLENTLWRTLP